MKLLKILFLLLISLNTSATEYDFPILRVIDGDTIEFQADFLPDPLEKKMSLRIYGIDTPEKSFRSSCDLEARMGESATKFTQNLIKNSKSHKIIIVSEDKYFRLLGDIILDGKSLKESLLEKGFARPYFGDKKRSWCD